MVTSITRIQSSLDLLLNKILICYCRSQVSKMLHVFKKCPSCFYIMIVPCILVTRQQHILSISLSGSFVTSAWCVLMLRMEETASRYGRQQQIYWKNSHGQPTLGGPLALVLGVGLNTPRRKNNLVMKMSLNSPLKWIFSFFFLPLSTPSWFQ
jgi:hypothetical protein